MRIAELRLYRLRLPLVVPYRIAITDVHAFDTVLVEDVPTPGHPYGVRGVGEVPIVPPAGALANAIYRATGIRMKRLPMSPVNMMEAIWEKEE